MMGMVKVDVLTGFSQLLAPQLLVVESAEEDVVVDALRGSITRSGTAMFIIDSILPKICGARAVNLTIFAGCSFSIMTDAGNLVADPTNSTSDG
jgi:hypothetical protein